MKISCIGLLIIFSFGLGCCDKKTPLKKKKVIKGSLDKKIPQITLAYDINPNPPYYIGSGTKIDKKKPGVIIEMVKFIEKIINIKIFFKRTPWKRSLRLLKRNRIEGVLNASFYKKWKDIGVYPYRRRRVDSDKRLMKNRYYLYKLRGAPVYWNGRRFINLKGAIGALSGYAIVDDLKRMGVKVYQGKNHNNNLKKLIKGHISGIVSMGSMIDFIIKQKKTELKKIKKVYPYIKKKNFYLIFSHKFYKKNRRLARRIWRVIALLRNSRFFKRLQKKYK